MTCLPINARRLVLIAVAVSVLVAGPWSAAALGAPPLNDSFASAQLLTGEVGEVVSTTTEATKEAGEPAHSGEAGGASVWFQWTAQRDGSLTMWTNVPTFNSVLGVYTGSAVGSLTEVASNNDYGSSVSSRVTFPVDAGTTYRIAVDGVGGAAGTFRLRWRQGPVNDFFADAAVLDGTSGSVEGNTFGATPEPGEVTGLNAASVWYRWTAPATGTFGFHLEYDGTLAVYTGSSIIALTAVGESEADVVVPAVAGTAYSIRVARGNWNADYPFTLFWGQAPANDAFANAVVIEGSKGSTSGSTAFATAEPSEPSAIDRSSVWYTWTAPSTGHVRFDSWMLRDETWGDSDTILAVYSGASLDTATVVARNDDWGGAGLPAYGSAVSFRAVAGTTYLISVEAYGSYSWGSFRLRWYPGAIILGKRAGEQLTGTAGRDYIDGGSGNDVVHGRGGNDIVVGGSGRDRLFGDGGSDLLDSRDFVRGNDEINGGPGRDSAVRDARDVVRNVP